MNGPEPVAVRGYGEAAGQKNIPDALTVLVAGQSVGGAERVEGGWLATWYKRSRSRHAYTSPHPTAEDAVAAVLASGFARGLGARKTSRVYWSERAKRRAGGAR